MIQCILINSMDFKTLCVYNHIYVFIRKRQDNDYIRGEYQITLQTIKHYLRREEAWGVETFLEIWAYFQVINSQTKGWGYKTDFAVRIPIQYLPLGCSLTTLCYWRQNNVFSCSYFSLACFRVLMLPECSYWDRWLNYSAVLLATQHPKQRLQCICHPTLSC